MTCGIRHVFAITTAVALAGAAVSAQQATTPPAAQTPRPAPPAPQTPRTTPPSGQTPRPAQTATTPSERASQTRDKFRASQGFSVVLVVADIQASTAPDDVPPAARRALTDMKEFLPYKSYKLVDAAWILGQSTGNTNTRLRGPEEREYEVSLATNRGDGASVGVRFTLKEAGISEQAVAEMATVAEKQREIELMEREISSLRQKLAEARRNNQEDAAKELRAQIDAAERRQRSASMTYQNRFSGRAGRTVIDTSFTMDVGETVVVGTSRLRGNSKALIALLTAVPAKPGKGSTESR
jgi:hypothetical protein